MRKILAIATALLVTTPAMAEGWNNHHRHGQGFAGVAPRHHHGGGDAGAALFGGLVGGLIIGGMINNMNQPRYYNQQVYQEYYEPACRQVIVNRYWNGWQWVSRVATVCD